MRLKRSLRVFTAVILLLLMCSSALAKVVSPGSDFYYLDNADVLNEALEGEIYFSNKLLYEACGAQIVVVTVDSSGRESIDDYAYDLFNEWGIGDASKNNGFLILLAIEDDDYYALPGSGLDSRFSAGTIKEMYDKYLETDFAAKRYEAGVKSFFEAVFERIATIYNADVTTEQGVAAYEEYISANNTAEGYGGYNGSRRTQARQEERRSESSFDISLLVVLIVLIVVVVLLSKGRRARRRLSVMPPVPPAPPMGIGYRPTRTIYHSSPRYSSGWSSGRSSSFGSSSGHSSSSSSSGRSSSFGSSSSRSSFGSSSGRSGGFGGGGGGGGGSRGGGAGRGRH